MRILTVLIFRSKKVVRRGDFLEPAFTLVFPAVDAAPNLLAVIDSLSRYNGLGWIRFWSCLLALKQREHTHIS